jgi:hypothetical protein
VPDQALARVVTVFKDSFSGRETLRTIEDFFTDLGFKYDAAISDAERERGHGQRRSVAAGYIDAALDLVTARDSHSLIRAVEFKLAEWEKTSTPQYRSDLDRLVRVLDLAGFDWDGHKLTPRAGQTAVNALAPRLRNMKLEDVDEEISRILAALEADPADAITACRALVEAVCKSVLEELNAPFADADDLAALYKKTAASLRIDPLHHEMIYRQILQGLVSTIHGLSELRNRFGDAHGRRRAAIRPQPRHARMAAGAAMTIATFLLETLENVRTTP